jgi:2,4-dienoyl-CoA reductase-like NADH-dependent reductase (Old Yellow Enzyme family)
MEGWDGTPDGHPSDHTFRRWQKFGQSGAKLIWGGEAVAVSLSGRANPNQLVIAAGTHADLARLRAVLVEEHRKAMGSEAGLLIGLQLTHSGRYCRPYKTDKPEPRILYRHPILDRKLNLPGDYPVLTDSEIEGIIEDFITATRVVRELGFDFVDVKHCHGYLGHEFLSAHTREGKYGGSFENRTRFLREIVAGIRSVAPGLQIGVRLSAFDIVPFRPDPSKSSGGKLGPGIPEPHEQLLPYRWGFGVNPNCPTEPDLNEPIRLLSLLQELQIPLVNITAGSPYYNPHLQRPALFPPSDGYRPSEDPLISVAQQLNVARELKHRFPDLIVVGTAYSYLQDFLPNVAQAVLREGWIDAVGLGRMTLTYPEILLDAAKGRALQHKRVCRTFSDCTTAPRKGLPSGCYPLDNYYKQSPMMVQLAAAKAKQ